MKIVPLTKEKYKAWDQFCLGADDAWFWHTTDYIDFSIAYIAGNNIIPLSFMLEDDTGIVAVCPLLLVTNEQNGRETKIISNPVMGGYGIIPACKNGLSDERKDKLLKFIFSYIDELAQKNGVKSAAFRFLPLLGDSHAVQNSNFNYLMKHGYLDHSLNTQVIDLTLPMDILLHQVRKGHKYDIKRGERTYIVEVYDKNNITEEIFENYRSLHHKASGRVTRPLITFDMMYQWIINGESILCGLKYNNDFIGFSLIIIYKKTAYYGSASDDPDVKLTVPISHLIQWEAIKWLKRNNITTYELGLQHYGPQIFNLPTRKDIDISLFKRGFGGRTATVYQGVKYYDKEYMREEYLQKLDALISVY